ncbi:MAG: ArsR/SmtB family transcription factor [Thermoplasmata archaeon]
MSEERFLKCVVDANRRRILTILGLGEMCVGDLVEETGMEQSLVSHHLRSLRNCGLVRSRKDGKKVLYRVSSSEITDILERIRSVSSTIRELAGQEECD